MLETYLFSFFPKVLIYVLGEVLLFYDNGEVVGKELTH